ncbi:noggin 5 [Carassius auratus]|uniref:Noggin n=1 Tax=Carassius auratus TaxID=7957 RepID=A0A6P6J7T8_CARAU|nr:noggin-2-like [Carassius auratus]XP_052409330.1 noggin 5 [Carassius gibelio]
MEMKVSPALVLCASVSVQLALAQIQLRVRPSPSDHLPVPDLHEDPDPALEPGERDLAPRLLRRKLGSSFDPVFSSIGSPTQGNGTGITLEDGISLAEAIPLEFQQLDFTGLKAAARTERRVRRWLWSYTRCPVLSVWKDLGARFWPRYVKEGQCLTDRSCSLPEGMFCKPVQSVSVTLLRWHCQQGSRALKHCAWIRARYPVISQCGCACLSFTHS